MTGPLLEPEKATQPPRLGVVSGLVLGLLSAVVVSWMSTEGWVAFLDATRRGGDAGVAYAGWLLTFGGVVLGLVGFAGRYHPLIPGVPTVWFAIVLIPSLIGLGAGTRWLPDFVLNALLAPASPAIFMVFGYLALATGVATMRRRRRGIFR